MTESLGPVKNQSLPASLELTHPLLRALYWCLSSPPFLTQLPDYPDSLLKCSFAEFLGDTTTELLNKLSTVEDSPQALETWVEERKTRRVGRLFENLIHYWLANHSEVDLIAHQQQISVEGRTLGELDFVFKINGALVHLETAVKYYLLAPCHETTKRSSAWNNLIGPNGIDTLARKALHLSRKQLPFGSSEAVRTQLDHHGPINSKALLQGYIFYPSTSPPQIIPGMASNPPGGFWTHADQLILPSKDPDTRWLVVDKPHWLGPLHCRHRDPQPLSKEALTRRIYRHFKTSNAALLVVGFQHDPNQPSWRESHRGIVVGPGWPYLVKPLRDAPLGSKSLSNY